MNPNSNFDPDEKDTSSSDDQSTDLGAENTSSYQPEDTATTESLDTDTKSDGESSDVTADATSDTSEDSSSTSPLADSQPESNIAPPETEPASQPMPAPVEENAATSAFATTPTTPPAKPAGKSKKMLIGSIVGLAAVLLLGGGAAAYALWYQNPQKVVTDSIVNAFKANSLVLDGTFKLNNLGDTTNSVEQVTLTFDSKSKKTEGQFNATLSIDAADKNYLLEASAMADADMNLYFKVKNVDSLVDELIGMAEMDSTAIDQLVDKINDKWIRIAAEDYEDVSQEASQAQECVSNVIKKYETDDNLRAQVSQAYKDNQFIVIEEELGSKDGNLGYVLDGDIEKAKAFANQLKETDIYKELKDCDDNFDFDADDVISEQETDEATESRFELWVSRFGHEIQQIKATMSDDEVSGEMTINTQFNQDVTVEAPTDYVPVKELVDDISRIIFEQMTQGQTDMTYEEYQQILEQSSEPVTVVEI